ncbi:MAG: hypothetical protein WC979_03210 [Candidatus Pacearchaeota archaeon]|jgi:hypothetical protein|nr:hypothetical protein [Clostridia bacterium]
MERRIQTLDEYINESIINESDGPDFVGPKELPVGTILAYEKNDNDKLTVYNLQVVKHYYGTTAYLRPVKFRSNASGANQWNMWEWCREKDKTYAGVLKHFRIIPQSEFEKIVDESELSPSEKQTLLSGKNWKR